MAKLESKSSADYWREREEEQRKHNIQEEKAYSQEIERIYRQMMNEIEIQINNFYTRYATKEGITYAEAKKRVSKLDIKTYAELAKKYVAEKNFSDQANEEMRLYNLTMKVNRLELLKANIGMHLVGGFDELQRFFEEKLTKRTIETFKRQAGILGRTVHDNARYAHSIVNASFHNATWSDRIWKHQDTLRNELGSLLSTGLIQGRNPRELARTLRKKVKSSEYNANRLMITEMARVQTEAQHRSFEENGFDQYTFHSLGTACPHCLAINGKHFDMKDMQPGVNAPPMHPNCVLPDTQIIAPDAEAIMKSEYSGDVVEIRTADGARLTVTPNHIMLTARGWVKAKNLIKGDKVVRYCGNVGSDVIGEPANHDSSTTIENLFASIVKSNSMTTFRMPVTSVDLKGDVIPDSEIDIVFINGELRDKLNSSFSKFISDRSLVGTIKLNERFLPFESSLSKFLTGIGITSDGIMGGLRVADILFSGSLTHHELVSLRLSSDYDTRIKESSTNRGATYSELLGNGFFAHSGNIKVGDLSTVEIDTDSRQFDSIGFHNPFDRVSMNAVNIRNFVDCFPTFVKFDNVDFINVVPFSGHVYDASCLSTLYIANGFVTSNCRCSTSAYIERTDFGVSDEEVKLFDEWTETYDKHGLSWRDWNSEREKWKKEVDLHQLTLLQWIKEVRLPSYFIEFNKQALLNIKGEIREDKIIITGEQKRHILERHPEAYKLVMGELCTALKDPDYILADKKENTGKILKRFESEGKYILAVLRLNNDEDHPDFLSSIITCWMMSERKTSKIIKKAEILYSKK